MDYEKAYKEALNWMRSIYPTLTGSDKEDAEHYFPELAESEDERIRKAIVELIHRTPSSAFESNAEFGFVGATHDEMLSYLEKQKEQNGEDGFLEDELSAFLQNYDKEYDDDAAVSDVARHFYEIGKKQKEQKNYRKLYEDIAKSEWFKKAYVGKSLGEESEQNEAEFREGYLHGFEDGQKEQKHNYCLYGGYPNVGRCRWCYADCSTRLTDVHTDEEKEYIRTIKSIISDFIRDKKPENLAYYQRIYDWLDGRHVPFSCGHEKGQPADPVFSKQEYESHPIISKDTTSVKPRELDGKTLLYTADKSYQIGFRDGVASVKPAEWSEEDEEMMADIIDSLEYAYPYDNEFRIAWLKSLRPQPKKELSIEKAIQWLDDTFYFLDNSSGRGRDCEITTHDFDSLEEMYDSFRKAVIVDSEPHWKPSEEQMEALDKARRFIPYNCDALESLYVDLKKL